MKKHSRRFFIQRVMKGETVEYQIEITFSGAGARALHAVYSPETNAHGEIIGWIGSIRDITDSKRTEDSLAESLRREQVDGFEFLRNLKCSSRNANITVLALTGFGRVEDIERARAAGFYTHLTKPLDVDILVETLRNTPRRKVGSR